MNHVMCCHQEAPQAPAAATWQALAQGPLGVLPRNLLQAILLTHTSTREKKALRGTCRAFRDMLDRQQTAAVPTYTNGLRQVPWLQRMQRHAHLHTLDLSITGSQPQATSFFDALPTSITALRLWVQHLPSLEPLHALHSLSVLSVRHCDGHEFAAHPLDGLQALSRLTSLEVDRPVGGLMHLAPTLRHLRLHRWTPHTAHAVTCLTHLEALEVNHQLPAAALPVLGAALPSLMHLTWTPDDRDPECLQLTHAPAWQAAPPRLTSLTLRKGDGRMHLPAPPTTPWPPFLPAAITRLTLVSPTADVIQTALAGLPRLTHVGLYRYEHDLKGWADALAGTLPCLTGLQSLELHVPTVATRSGLPKGRLLAELPPVADALQRGGLREVRIDTDHLSDVRTCAIAPTWPRSSQWTQPQWPVPVAPAV